MLLQKADDLLIIRIESVEGKIVPQALNQLLRLGIHRRTQPLACEDFTPGAKKNEQLKDVQ